METELLEENSNEKYIKVGINISLLKTLINILYDGINEEINENKQATSNLTVLLKRLIEEIYKDFEEIEQEKGI